MFRRRFFFEMLVSALVAAAALVSFNCQKKEVPAAEEEIPDSVRVADSIKAIEDSLARYAHGEIKPNQGIFQALRSLGVDNPTALELINALRFEVELRFLKVGEKIRVRFSEDSSAVFEFMYEPNIVVDHILLLDTSTGKYQYFMHKQETQTRYRIVEGKLEEGSTLNQSLLDLNVPPNLTQVINGILMCKISFRTQARKGDMFKALLKEKFYKGVWIEGSVLHASYTGSVAGFHEAFRYHDRDPKSTYNAHYTIKGEALVHSGLRYPINRLHITSNYGWRRHPITGRRQMHYGVDYKARVGEPIYAVAKGKVVISTYDQYSGNKIAIRHSDNSTSYYLHLSKRLVSSGQSVITRQIIGRAGRTGRVSGPHLHFGFKNARGKWINPLSKRMIATPKLAGKRLKRLQDQIRDIQHIRNDLEAKRKGRSQRPEASIMQPGIKGTSP